MMRFTLLSKSLAEQSKDEINRLKEEFKRSLRCGEGRLGNSHFFYRYFLRIRYVSYQEIIHAYLREESGESGEFLLKEFYLMLVFRNGQKEKLRFEREKNAREVLSYLEEHYPDIKIGFYK